MPFKLLLRLVHDQSGGVLSERSFDQEIVVIGRRDTNDVQLQDQRRLVSGRHAEIREKENRYTMVDVGSRNGTQLNGQRLDAGKEYPLQQGDQIVIGDFLIQFHMVKPFMPEGGENTKHSVFAEEVIEEANELVAGLKRIFSEHAGQSPEGRKRLMLELFRDVLNERDKTAALMEIRLIECAFPEYGHQQKKIVQEGSSVHSVECSAGDFEVYKASYQGLLKIAGGYLDHPYELKSQGEVNCLIDRIDSALKVILSCLSRAIKGRRQFEEEFDVEATRIFSWRPNPVKLVENEKEMGEYLLDWRRKETIHQAATDLEEAFTDLALHQMGLMEGFKECLKGILEQLNPALLESETQDSAINLGPLKIHSQFGPLASLAAWNRFKEKYRKLSEEEVKTFETILGPRFAKGYLYIQGKKKKDAQ